MYSFKNLNVRHKVGRAALLATVSALCSISAFAGAVPLSLSGWNADIIAGPSGVTGPNAQVTAELGSYWALYSAGSPGLGSTLGLPSTGSFTSALDGTTQFQLQAYSSNNAVDNSGTVTLDSPAAYNSLSFLVETISTDSAILVPWQATLTFSDTSTVVVSASTPHWTNDVGPVAIDNFGLIGALSGSWSGYNYTGGIALYQVDYALGVNAGKTISSIAFANNGGTGTQADLLAVSGVANTPEPASMLLAGLALSGFGLLKLRRR